MNTLILSLSLVSIFLSGCLFFVKMKGIRRWWLSISTITLAFTLGTALTISGGDAPLYYAFKKPDVCLPFAISVVEDASRIPMPQSIDPNADASKECKDIIIDSKMLFESKAYQTYQKAKETAKTEQELDMAMLVFVESGDYSSWQKNVTEHANKIVSEYVAFKRAFLFGWDISISKGIIYSAILYVLWSLIILWRSKIGLKNNESEHISQK